MNIESLIAVLGLAGAGIIYQYLTTKPDDAIGKVIDSKVSDITTMNTKEKLDALKRLIKK